MVELTGRILRAGCPGWEAARRNFKINVDYDASTPECIVFCQSVEDVQNAVRYAREKGIPIRARSGRHSYEAYSIAAGALVIDVSELEAITVDTDRQVARVGAGVFCLDLHERLYDVGVTLPAASGASVGIAGLALGGGFGVTSRKYGLTCDNIRSVALVNAAGDAIVADPNRNADLLWACQGGGGGNFGVVTSFEFAVHPIGFVALCNIAWPWQAFETIVDAWQRWGPKAPDELSTFLRLGANRVITLFGQMSPDDPSKLPAFYDLLKPLLEAAPPTSVSIQAMPYSAAAAVFGGADPAYPKWLLHPHNDTQAFKSTSAVAFEPFSAQAIAALRQQMERAAVQADWETNQPSMVQLLAAGAATARVPVDGTAVPHRNAQFVVQYDAYWTDPADERASVEWVEGVRTAMLPYAQGAYVNYVDHLIDDPLRAYYGPNLDRLVSVKRAYDPENVFSFPQSIPV